MKWWGSFWAFLFIFVSQTLLIAFKIVSLRSHLWLQTLFSLFIVLELWNWNGLQVFFHNSFNGGVFTSSGFLLQVNWEAAGVPCESKSILASVSMQVSLILGLTSLMQYFKNLYVQMLIDTTLYPLRKILILPTFFPSFYCWRHFEAKIILSWFPISWKSSKPPSLNKAEFS